MKHLILSLFALAAPVASGCDSTEDPPATATVTATVVADPQLSTLEAAVVRANLAAALAAENGTFTVFAPTDAAFAAALEALDLTAEELLALPTLGAILQLHVVATAALEAADLSDGQTVTTLNGQTLTVRLVNGRVGLDTQDAGTAPDAFVTTADVQASNGVIHKIDAVLLPAE